MNLHQRHRSGPRLWLALRLSHFPLEVLHVDPSEQPIIVSEKKCVIYTNDSAYAEGIRCGFDLTTAQLMSHCETYERDPIKEMDALKYLSSKLYQFTPYIEIYNCQTLPYAGLLLEISTCLKLFSGVIPLIRNVSNFFSTTPYSCEISIAHTAKGAWLLTFQKNGITGNETKELFCARLNKLPIQLLHDFPKEIVALEKTGFKTLGDISRQIDAQTITGIKKRLGVHFAQAVCDIFGIEHRFQQNNLFDKPLPIYKPREFFSESIQFDYPISQTDQLLHPIEHLLKNLSDYLRRRQLQCQHIEWKLSDIYKNTFLLQVHSDSPETYWELFYDLTLIQLENQELPFEVDSLNLRCCDASQTQTRSQNFSFDEKKQSHSDVRSFTITIAKLKARLGDAAVFKLSYCDAILPETTNQTINLSEPCNQELPEVHKKSIRPAWLFSSPVAIEQRAHGLYWRGRLSLLAGPERIRSTWWINMSARDYFIALRHDHVRLWVFLDLHTKIWYVHGIFG